MRERGAIRSAVAITSAMPTGTVRKIAVQMMLFVSADQNTGSSNMCWKFANPAHAGTPTPSQITNAAANVSMAGIRMMQMLISSAGSANSHTRRSGGTGRERRNLAFLRLLAEQGLDAAKI